ncbi:MAG: hypothetical protein NT163_00600 [Chlorobiales bacterium]|nr:hypothetical protein [Chlorobiales bacterium]
MRLTIMLDSLFRVYHRFAVPILVILLMLFSKLFQRYHLYRREKQQFRSMSLQEKIRVIL